MEVSSYFHLNFPSHVFLYWNMKVLPNFQLIFSISIFSFFRIWKFYVIWFLFTFYQHYPLFSFVESFILFFSLFFIFSTHFVTFKSSFILFYFYLFFINIFLYFPWWKFLFILFSIYFLLFSSSSQILSYLIFIFFINIFLYFPSRKLYFIKFSISLPILSPPSLVWKVCRVPKHSRLISRVQKHSGHWFELWFTGSLIKDSLRRWFESLLLEFRCLGASLVSASSSFMFRLLNIIVSSFSEIVTSLLEALRGYWCDG